MNNIVITKETTVKEAMSGNGVLMVGKILNKREFERQQATEGKRLIMAGRLPNKREVEMSTMITVNQSPAIKIEDEGKVEIAEFFLRAQDERIARIKKQQELLARKRKKASSRKPSLKNIIVNTLKSL